MGRLNLVVGKDYRCGEVRVRIIHIESSADLGGMMSSESFFKRVAFALVVDGYNEVKFNSDVGVFDADGCGMYSSNNMDFLCHYLTEIKEEPKEMTVGEVQKALGIENLKIVEEN